MKKNKFRTWVKSDKKMLYGKRAYSVKHFTDSYGYLDSEVEIMQCTGLSSKHEEQDIYESDILKDERGLVVVFFDEENAWFAVGNENVKMHLAEYIRDNDFKVVGNIHENEELLKAAAI